MFQTKMRTIYLKTVVELLENDKYMAVDDDGANTISGEERNLAGEKPQKYRLLSDILKELAGPCDAVSAGCDDSEISSEIEDDFDDFTLNKFVRKKKGIRATSKSGVESKKKKRSCKVRERSYDWAKRMKHVPADSCYKEPELCFKRQLRKTRIDEAELMMQNKHKKSPAEIIVHERNSQSQKVAPSSLEVQRTSQEPIRKPFCSCYSSDRHAKKDSLELCGNKRNRETTQDDSGTEVFMLLDDNSRCFTEENSSRSPHGVKIAQLVQPTISILNNKETAFGYVKKTIRDNSPPIDNESMAALQLLRIFNSGSTTHTTSSTATEDLALSVSKGEISYGMDEKVPPASGSFMDQSNKEFSMINVDGLPKPEETELETSVCVMNMNPSEFSIFSAKKYMRRVKVCQK